MAGSVVRIALAVALALAAAVPAEAAPGDLDPKILVAGYAGASGPRDFAVLRYTATGTLDTAFSGDGKQTTDIGGDDQANAMIRRRSRSACARRRSSGSARASVSVVGTDAAGQTDTAKVTVTLRRR